MPIRGENVGTAYVRILADGSGLPDSIRDELDDTDDIWDKKGREDGDRYAKGVRSGLNKNQPKTQKEVEELFRVRAERNKRIVASMTGPVFRQIENDIKKWHGDTLGEEMVRKIRKGFLSGGGFQQFGDDFEKLFDQLPQVAERAIRDVQAAERREHTERLARLKNLDAAYQGLADDRVRAARRANAEELKDFDAQMRRIDHEARLSRAAIQQREKEWRDSFDRMTRAADRLRRGVANADEGIAESLGHTRQHVAELREEMTRLNFDDNEFRKIRVVLDDTDRGLIRINPRFRQFNGALERMAPRIGRAFGRGARNDLVNFIGVTVQGMTNMAFAIPRGIEALQGMTRAAKAAGESVGLMTRFSGVAASVAGRMASLGPAIAAVAIAIPILVVVIGTVVSALSALLAIISALAGSIYFALIGSLAALGGALVPVIAGIGVLAGAILSMSDAQKEALKTAIRPFVDGMKEMGRSAADIIFGGQQFETTIKRMTNALTSSGMRRLVDGIAQAIGNVGSGWARSLDSPGFQRFINVMADNLPKQFESLGRIIDRTFAGIGGTLIALQPLVNRFLGWLEDIVTDWAEWAQSDKGQKAMVQFFKDAGDSASSLGGFLKEVGGLIQDIFFSGQKTGDGLFDDMADAIARFRDYIADGGLEQWFKDAKKFADDLGGAIKTVGKVLDALDTPEFRSFAGFALDVFSHLLDIVNDVIEPIADAAREIQDFIDVIKRLGDGDFKGVGSDIISGLWEGIMSDIDTIVQPFRDFIGWVKGVFGINSPSTVFMAMGGDIIAGLVMGLVNAAQAVLDFFLNLGSQALTALATGLAALPGVLGSALSTAFAATPLGMALDLGSRLASTVGSAISTARDRVASAAGELAGSAVSAFQRAQAGAGRFAGELTGRLSTALSTARTRAGQTAGEYAGRLATALDRARERAGTMADTARTRLANALDRARGKAGDLAGSFAGRLANALSGARSLFDSIAGAVRSVADRLGDLISMAGRAASALSRIKMPSLGGIGGAIGGLVGRLTARGGVFNGAQTRIIGEAGPEAVVPLNRSLSQVDPAVRALSAFAQGKGFQSAGTGGGTTIDASGWQVVTPSRNPEAVAKETFDMLAAKLAG